MQAPYVVHASAVEDVPVTVEVNGQPVAAKVRGLVLELVSPQGLGSLMVRLVVEDPDAALEAYPAGAAVTLAVQPA